MTASTIAPGPKGLGSLNSLVDFYRDPINLFEKLYQQYGDIVRLEGLGYCAHLITQPDDIKYVLQDNAKNYQLSGIFEETTPVVGRGLTTNNGPSWLRQRRLVQSAFQHQYIPLYANTIVSFTEQGLNSWKDFMDEGVALNINDEILTINLRILGMLLFSVDFQPDNPFLEALGLVRQATIARASSIIKLPTSPRVLRAIQTVDEFTLSEIADRRQHGNPHKDILSTMMTATLQRTEIGMTGSQLRDEVITLFFAAYEDVANALAWTWYLFAQNPEVESKLRAEIQAQLGGRAPEASDLSNLPYLTMTVNEVLRLYPTTWSLLREAIEDDEIGGYHIPAKSTLMFDLYLTQRLPKYWAQPERFMPERFTPGNTINRPRFAYFPFGGGPRQCIGNELALMEIKLILVRMMQMYRFTLESKTKIEMNALSSLQPRGGVWVKIKPA